MNRNQLELSRRERQIREALLRGAGVHATTGGAGFRALTLPDPPDRDASQVRSPRNITQRY